MEKSISVSNECGSQWLWFIAILEVTKNGEQSSQNWYESLMVIRNSVWRKIGNKHDIKQYEYPNCAWKVLCFCALTFWPNELMGRLH